METDPFPAILCRIMNIVITVLFKPVRTLHSLHLGLTAEFLFLVGFVALRPKSTAMVIAGRSVHLTTLFPGQA